MSNERKQDEYTFSQSKYANSQEIKKIPGPPEKSVRPSK